MENKFPRNERLRRRSTIRQLFAQGNRFTATPFRVHFLLSRHSHESSIQILIPVPKHNLHRAPDRNLMRRRIREAYRTNNNALHTAISETGTTLLISISYYGKEIMPFEPLKQKIILILQRLSAEIEKFNR